jgi:hypothetical protein
MQTRAEEEVLFQSKDISINVFYPSRHEIAEFVASMIL